ncbi:YitT family protein [Peptacetobacter hominis]|uniref:YitT family protein n=1 Tax=Peptacetobacter hominis TaxID=2743610 RepID=A0A544QTA3_9FIRM|nr:YitT family protein [Peptacetobacter hominis]TQQ83914.1 YitT family protein [Peptacetobacter hominis]
MKENLSKNILFNIVAILFGNALYALAVVLFIVPNGLITGGTTGLSLLFFNQFGFPIAIFNYLFNTAMFIIGFIVLGKRFALTTLISTFFYPTAFAFFEKTIGYAGMTENTLLAVICAGIMIGVAIGIVIKCGASTGGMDIPPLVLNKKFGIPVAVAMYGFDFMILLSQMIFSNKEMVLYGLLLVLTYTTVLNNVLMFGKSQTQVKIVSKEYEKINNMVITELDRGTTLIKAETGYLKNEYPMVLTVVSNRELAALNQKVLDIDSNAFMIISKVNEVHGRGFTLKKEFL